MKIYRSLTVLVVVVCMLIIGAVNISASSSWIAASADPYGFRLSEPTDDQDTRSNGCDDAGGGNCGDRSGDRGTDKDITVTPKGINCPSKDITIVVSKVTNTPRGSQYSVKYHVTLKCAGVAVTTPYEARDKTSGFRDEKLLSLHPDATGDASDGGRVFQVDPSGSEITVTVVGSDGVEVSSAGVKIPEG